MIHLLNKFDASLKKYNVIKSILKAFLFVFIILHWISCLWFFINTYADSKGSKTWIEYQGITNVSLAKQILY